MYAGFAAPAPFTDRTTGALPEREGVGEHPAPRAGVLLAEDDDGVRDVLQRWLSVQGYHVWAAGNGFEAVRVYRQHQASIDLALLDVRMPGLDGPETLAALRAVNPSVRVAFMSGQLGTYSVEQLLSLGACGFLAKPFRLEHVTELLRQWTASIQETVALP